MYKRKGMSTIIGEVILVSFALAISLAYLAYINSSITEENSNLPPSVVAEAQKNTIEILEFEHTNTSVVFTVNVVFNVKIATLISVLGYSENDIPVPLAMNSAYEFGGSGILYPNTTLPILKIGPGKVVVMYKTNYYKLSDFGVPNDVYAVRIPFSSPIIRINSSIYNANLDKIKIIALTQVNNNFYEYAAIEINMHENR